MQGACCGQLGVLQFLGLGDVEGGVIRGEALADRVEVDGESCCRRAISEEVSRSSLKANRRGTELGSGDRTEARARK